jgi:hypothetical protein
MLLCTFSQHGASLPEALPAAGIDFDTSALGALIYKAY